MFPFRRCLFRYLPVSKQFDIKNFHSVTNIINIPVNTMTNHSSSRKRSTLLEPRYSGKHFSTDDNKSKNDSKINEIVIKPSVFKRFKQMYRDYWYVLLPVHVVTSIGWFGGFYYLAKSGVDVASFLQYMRLSDSITSQLKDYSMGYLAVSVALYKISTPLRYTVTLGGTTIAIKYLKELGYIKPVPCKEKIKELYLEKRNHFRETIQETKHEIIQRKHQLKERKDNIITDYVNFKKELKHIKAK